MNQITTFRNELDRMSGQFHAALPAHMPVKRFQRVVVTAIQNNPDLLLADRQSLWNSCMRAAQDGLLPDGREGAIVPYKDKSGKKIAQWIPMVAGLRKKARNSGDLSTWDCHAVYENDEFDYQLGDEPFIHHKPTLVERGELIAVYSIATMKDKSKSRDVMSKADVDKVRAIAHARNGPAWTDHYDEMAKKTVARRHSKQLPLSSDLDEFIRRDDSLYTIGETPPRPKLSDFSNEPDASDAYAMGIEARDAGKVIEPPSSVPEHLQDAYRAGWNSRDEELKPAPVVPSGEGKAAPGQADG